MTTTHADQLAEHRTRLNDLTDQIGRLHRMHDDLAKGLDRLQAIVGDPPPAAAEMRYRTSGPVVDEDPRWVVEVER